MSTDSHNPPGGKLEGEALMAEAKRLVEAEAIEQEQLDLLEPLTAEELAEARAVLGANAGGLSVVKHAREQRKGRPKGVKNRRTDDFVRYLSQFGPDPAVAAMQILAAPEEVHMERSRRERMKVVGKGETARVVTITEEMTYEAAQSARLRAADMLMPYWHSKKPVAIDATIHGLILKQEIGEIRPARGAPLDGGILGFASPDDGGGEE
jgi:hypothetical protein